MRSTGSILAWSGLALALGVAAPAGAAVDELAIQGLSIQKTITCDSRDVVIYGASHRLTFLGRCQNVTVHGTGHVIHVERLGRGHVDGLNNRLEWEQALRGERPDIFVTGVNNRAVHVEGRPVTSREEDSDQDSIAIEGDGGRVVVGSGGVSVDGGSKRRRDGQVTITGGGVGVEVDGGRGSVRVGTEQAPSRGLVISGSEKTRDYDCAGGNVEVEGSENHLRLSHCRELTVSGGDNHIVLVGPVRLILLEGADNTVQWSEGEGGKAPRIETPGAGNHVVRK